VIKIRHITVVLNTDRATSWPYEVSFVVRFPKEARNFSLLQASRPGMGPIKCARRFSPQRPGRIAKHIHPSADNKNEWSYTSTRTCFHGVQRV